MNAQEITKVLGGRWSGNSGLACCPAHQDKTPSLSLCDVDGDKLLTHCFSGCPPAAVWGALQDRGLVERGDHRAATRRRTPRPQPAPGPSPNQDHALAILRASKPAENTPVEAYLRGRGITIKTPPTIRYHPAVKHANTDLHLPCLIAAACNVDSQVTGVQRIFLTLDGRKAPVNRPKMALGTLRGSTVRLAPTTDRVCLTEGVEDALALVQMTGDPAWALLGAGNFKTVELPKSITQVVLAPDGDEKGQGVIQEAANRLAGQGREVRAAKIPAGKDWVDVLEEYEERAAILEIEAHLTREEAEIRARREILDG